MNEPSNLLAPLVFDDGEITKFIHIKVCATCLSHLNAMPAPGRKWYAECPNCGPILPHNFIDICAAELIESGVRAGAIEIDAGAYTDWTTDQLLKSLGY